MLDMMECFPPTEEMMTRLRSAVEERAGTKMNTSRDFDFLSEQIFAQQHQTISPTTLKRLWGYLKEDVKPRLTSLNILVQFAGYADWEHFCKETESLPEADEVQPEAAQKGSSLFRPPLLLALSLVLCGGVAAVLWFLGRGKAADGMAPAATAVQQPSRSVILRKGNVFSSHEDYLSLFGIEAKDTLWYQPVPHLQHVFVWGPQYQHPNWHNEGDKDSLMPTITEWWTPAEGTDDPKMQQALCRINREGYDVSRRHNDIRIAFMKDLLNANFVFLGVYRMSLEKSDTMHIVWERVAEECDLNHLEQLLQYRN